MGFLLPKSPFLIFGDFSFFMLKNNLSIVEDKDGLRIKVKLHPQSSRNSIDGIQDGRLKVSVTSPAEKGKANEALIRLLAKVLGIAKSNIEIAGGETSREKVLLIQGVDARQLNSMLKF